MAGFCKQCSLEIFDEDYGDFIGLRNPDETDEMKGDEILDYISVICEECGPTYVDASGTCVNPDCLKEHGRKPLE